MLLRTMCENKNRSFLIFQVRTKRCSNVVYAASITLERRCMNDVLRVHCQMKETYNRVFSDTPLRAKVIMESTYFQITVSSQTFIQYLCCYINYPIWILENWKINLYQPRVLKYKVFIIYYMKFTTDHFFSKLFSEYFLVLLDELGFLSSNCSILYKQKVLKLLKNYNNF